MGLTLESSSKVSPERMKLQTCGLRSLNEIGLDFERFRCLEELGGVDPGKVLFP